eukprot:CAMPEP_0194299596 /NCGR_PEP_ID=MMETSP0169-20130528/60800_1 /TAXON_ID=218684 /ORGANISM="Corethron pennatum, Strain L29A3" /LENGTH=59 /DNA_ID=CAMNT_0039049699 /DNA_START=294 /DNA_END=473 /DNA_ORIENTATION=+
MESADTTLRLETAEESHDMPSQHDPAAREALIALHSRVKPQRAQNKHFTQQVLERNSYL